MLTTKTGNTLDQALAAAQHQIPECLGIGYVDLDSGLLLGVKTTDTHPNEVLELVAAATADLFVGPNISMIENIFKDRRQDTRDTHYFRDYAIWSENLIHIFLRGKKYESYVLCVVCRISANFGMVLSKSRMSLPSIEATV